MITRVKFGSLNKFIQAQRICQSMNCDVGVHFDNGVIADIRTFMEPISMDVCSKSVNIVSENEEYHKKLREIEGIDIIE